MYGGRIPSAFVLLARYGTVPFYAPLWVYTMERRGSLDVYRIQRFTHHINAFPREMGRCTVRLRLRRRVGNTNEFKSYEMLTCTTAYGPALPKRLVITDDTQMTLSLARAIHTAGTADVEALRSAIVAEFVAWRSDPDNNRAPGTTCLRATAALAAGAPWTAATVVASDGCGTVMRTSPAAFLPDHLWRPVAAWQAAITHGTARGIAAALVMTAIIREAARGRIQPGKTLGYATKLCTHPALRQGVGKWLAGHPQASAPDQADAFLTEGLHEVGDVLRHAHRAVETFRRNPWGDDPCRHAGEGWRAQETLAVALLCIDALPTYPVLALRRATVTGGDSDSIAAVAGAILGALHRDPWPTEWAERLEPRYRDWISTAKNYQIQPRPSSSETTEFI